MNSLYARTDLRKNRSSEVMPVVVSTQHERTSLSVFTGASGATTCSLLSPIYYPLNNANALRMSYDVSGSANLAGGESITITLYRLGENQVYYIVGTLTTTVPAVTSGNASILSISDAYGLVSKATHFKITTGSVTVASGCVAIFGIEYLSDTSGGINRGYSALTDSYASSEASPLDQSMTAGTSIVDTTTDIADGATMCYPAAAATPTSCWDVGGLNARSGQGRDISFTGHIKTGSGATALLKVFGSNDPNATAASKRWTQVAFYDDRAAIKDYVENISVGASTTANYAIVLNQATYRYYYISLSTSGGVIDEHSVYLCAAY